MRENVKVITEENCKYGTDNINLKNCSDFNLYGIQIASQTSININNSNSFDMNSIKNPSKKINIKINKGMKFSISNIKEVKA